MRWKAPDPAPHIGLAIPPAFEASVVPPPQGTADIVLVKSCWDSDFTTIAVVSVEETESSSVSFARAELTFRPVAATVAAKSNAADRFTFMRMTLS